MAYIGNGPGVASQRIVSTFEPTTDTTTFSPSSGYTVGYVDVYLNGVKLQNGTDFTASNGSSVVLTDAAVSGDFVEVIAFIPRGLSDGYTKSEAETKFLDATSNLSDIGTPATARTNLGLGTAATTDSTAYATAAQGTKADSAVQNLSDLSITATAAEINKLDGVTATTTELNYVDGVTSNIQTQLNAKQATLTAGTDYLTPTGDGSNLTGINTDLVSDTSPQLGGNLDTNNNNINFGDNDKAQFGTSNDLAIYHNGSHSYIAEAGTGNLNILATNLNITATDGSRYITGQDGGYTRLWYAGTDAVKLETNSSGVDVTGTVDASSEFDVNGTLLANSTRIRVPSNSSNPASGSAGEIYYHSTDSTIKFYDGSDWNNIYTPPPQVEVLVQAGGAGGGWDDGGGGGAGGLCYIAALELTAGTNYTITVGAGGSGATSSSGGNNGSNSSAFGIVALGGGGGAGQSGSPKSGGCGGGARRPTTATQSSAGGTQTDSGGATGYGYAGGNSVTGQSGGGGGTSEEGNVDGQQAGGDGRDYSSSFGTSVGVSGVFGGGGGGAGNITGVAGTGGGGTGSNSGSSGGNGTANTGGGGGGGDDGQVGGSGGSGAVIVKILTSLYTGTTTGSPTVTTDGSYTILEYTSTGSYTA